MVVAQLVERSLPLQEVCSSNPVIGKKYIEHLITVNCVEKTKMKKRGQDWPFLKKYYGIKLTYCFSFSGRQKSAIEIGLLSANFFDYFKIQPS